MIFLFLLKKVPVNIQYLACIILSMQKQITILPLRSMTSRKAGRDSCQLSVYFLVSYTKMSRSTQWMWVKSFTIARLQGMKYQEQSKSIDY